MSTNRRTEEMQITDERTVAASITDKRDDDDV